MKLYADSLHELSEKANVTIDEIVLNGTAIIGRILKRKYTSLFAKQNAILHLPFLGIQGFDMRIDENGDAEGMTFSKYPICSFKSLWKNLLLDCVYFLAWVL